ncbi:MAG TPA: hypothetical protein VHW44_18445 [Pseudonocardiaceae bacterium]|nr:hypothetical protein [Pseudonocardiaceae bacterium]
MGNNVRWRMIPTTRAQCILSLIAGVLLTVSGLWQLFTTSVRVPVLEVLVAVLGVVLIICALIGLASPGSRGGLTGRGPNR